MIVTVTAAHIRQGMRGHPEKSREAIFLRNHCAVALALREATGQAWGVAYDNRERAIAFLIGSEQTGGEKRGVFSGPFFPEGGRARREDVIVLPESADRFAGEFDAGRDVTPFTFDFSIAPRPVKTRFDDSGEGYTN